MLKAISIRNVKPGMFVEDVTKQSGNMRIKNRGWVRTQSAIKELIDRGVEEVVVDLSKSITTPLPISTKTPPKENKKLSRDRFDAELVTARKLYAQAQFLQQQLLASIAAQKDIDSQSHRKIAEDFVASLKRMPDALLCMATVKGEHKHLIERSINTAILMAHFAISSGMDERKTADLTFTCFLYDIGMIMVPKRILSKESKLTAKEKNVVERHVEFGIDLLKRVSDTPQHLLDVIAMHHERMDGSGYPNGLAGSQINRFGRMLGIVDSYDAMTTPRTFAKTKTPFQALSSLMIEADIAYDKPLVHKFIKVMGAHPSGSIVKLSNGKLAMVCRQNIGDPNQPLVKQFYSLSGKHFIAPEYLDLSSKQNKVAIEKNILASDFDIDFSRFFDSSIAP